MSDRNSNLNSFYPNIIVGNTTPSGFSQNQLLTNYSAVDPNIPTGALEAIKDETHLTFNVPPSPFFDLSGIATSITLDGSALLTSAGFAGANISPNYNGSGSLVRLYGMASQPTINSGTIGQYMAAVYGLNSNFGGTVPSMVSVYADSPILFGGTTVDNYGVFIEDQSTSGATNNWNIYSNGTGSDNHFEGKLTVIQGISMGLALDAAQIATPSNPSSGRDKLYFKSGDGLYSLNSSGVEVQYLTGSSGANVHLSNLASPTAINQNLLFNSGINIGTPTAGKPNIVNAVTSIVVAPGTISDASGGIELLKGSSAGLTNGGVVFAGTFTTVSGFLGSGEATGYQTFQMGFTDNAAGDTPSIYLGGSSGSKILGLYYIDSNDSFLEHRMAYWDFSNAPTSVDLRIQGSLGVGNSASATTLGSVVKKIEIFDASGVSLGFIPVYDSIT